VFRHPDGTRSVTCCSYFGRATGSEASEHTGLRCALGLARGLNLPVPSRLRFNMDSQNGAGRYLVHPPVPLRQDMKYLEPLILLNHQELRALHDMGHSIVVQKIHRDLNTEANDLARVMLTDARNGGPGVPLVLPGSGLLDTALGTALAEHSARLTVLQQRGGPNRNHRPRGRGGPRLEPAWPSREFPQPPGTLVCASTCQLCLLHRCGFPHEHELEVLASGSVHMCPDYLS